MIDISPNRKIPSIPIKKHTESTTHFLIFDVESRLDTDDKGFTVHTPYLVSYCILSLSTNGDVVPGDIGHVTTKAGFEDVITASTTKYRNITMIAHNTGYDFSALDLWTYLDEHDYKVITFNPMRGSYFMLFRTNKHEIRVIDNLNFFTGKLSKLGDELGIRKLPMPKRQVASKAMIRYCRRDVEIVREALIELSKITGKYNMGALTITRAKLAMEIFQRNFLHSRIILHNNRHVLNREYLAYYGGRTEAFYQGTASRKDYYYLDFNSLYPSVMKNQHFSTRLRFTFRDMSVEKLDDVLTRYNGLATVDLDTDVPAYPLRYDDGIMFPVGKFTTHLADAELRHAIQHGHVTKIHGGSLYYREDIFTDYIDHFHALKTRYKTENKPIFTYMCKLMLNSLYGKFGQRISTLKATGQTDHRRYDVDLTYDDDTRKFVKSKIINYKVYRESGRQISTLSVPVIVSEITALARMKLWEAMTTAGLDHIYYLDTDSLVVDKTGYDRLKPLIGSGRLGALELEQRSRHLKINALKDYEFGKKVTIKAVPFNAKKVKDNMYEYVQFGTTLDILSRRKGYKMFSETEVKVLERRITKGLKLANNRIVPWRLNQVELL